MRNSILHPNVYRAVIVMTEQGFRSIAGLACGVIIARACSTSIFANYILLTTIALFAQGIQINLDGIPFTVLSGNCKKTRNYDSGTILQHLITTLLIVVILAPLVYLSCGTPKNPITISLVICFCIFYASQTCNQFVRYFLMARLAIIKCFLIGTSYAVIALILLGLWFHSGSDSFDLALLYMAIAFAAPLIPILFVEGWGRSWSFAIAWRSFRTNFAFGKWLCIDSMFSIVAFQANPWLLKYHDTGYAVAQYGVYMTVCGLLNPISQSLGRLIFPLLVAAAHKGHRELNRCILLGLSFCAAIIIPYLMIMFFFGDWIIAIMFGNKYGNPGSLLMIFAVAFSIELSLVVIQYSIQAIGCPKFIPMSRMIAMCITIAGAFAVLSYGVEAAGWCYLLARLSQAITLTCILLLKEGNISTSVFLTALNNGKEAELLEIT